MSTLFRNFTGSVICALVISVSSFGCVNGRSNHSTGSVTSDFQSPFSQPGESKVAVRVDVWNDTERNRAIPVKLYVPDTSERPPVVIFSHGLGGSIEAASYLGSHLASWGFLAVHIQHPGSDSEVWMGLNRRPQIYAALAKAARDPNSSVNRFNDLHFVIDEIEQRVAIGSLQADVSRIGMAGHSFGAHSVLAAAGRRSLSADDVLVSFKDSRVKAGLALSPPAPAQWATPERYDDHYGDIDIPLMHITGTEDLSPLDRNSSAKDRQIAFSVIPSSPQYLIVFDGADHAVFGGRNRSGSPKWYPEVQVRVAQAATAFFQSALNKDSRAVDFLSGSEFESAYRDVTVTKRKHEPE